MELEKIFEFPCPLMHYLPQQSMKKEPKYPSINKWIENSICTYKRISFSH
jgi:hypothetical protein